MASSMRDTRTEMTRSMRFALRREGLPQTVLTALPFLLFFPHGIAKAGVVVFMLSVLVSGKYRNKWRTAKASPLFWPVAGMFAVSCLLAVLTDRSAPKFWSGFAHYQVYFFLLLFISVGPGDWQRRAANGFFAGALLASTLFYVNLLDLLPDVRLFGDYIAYSGNNSILLGVLLAIAAGALFYEMIEHASRRRLLWQIPAFLYIAVALLVLARTRSGSLIFIGLCLFVLVKQAARSWHRALGISAVLALMVATTWHFSSNLQTRALKTVQDIKAFSQGEKTSGEGIRAEMYWITAQMIAEKPLAGHGIGAWLPVYQQRAKGLATGRMTTPHNDYLLYMAEIGLIGLAALLWIWAAQLAVAWRIGGVHGAWLGMLSLALIVGAMFNAILRDWVFGLAFMILMAIPLAGVTRDGRTARPAASIATRS